MIKPLSKLGPSGLTRRQEKARQARQDAKARRACCDTVWQRAGAMPWGDSILAWCEKCAAPVARAHEVPRLVGHVDEIVSRAQGGNPHDPDNCRLVCYDCHFSGPSGAHRQSERRTA